MKIKDLVNDLTYEEIKIRRWKHPIIWRWNKKLIFKNYIISEDGIILKIKKHVGKKMKASLNSDGYPSIRLTHSIIQKRVAVKLHRLLWETWIGKIPDGHQINHKDGVKTNNDLYTNLEVVTQLENMQHAYRNGLFNIKSGKEHPQYGRKFPEEHRENIRKSRLGKKLSQQAREKISGTKNINAILDNEKVDQIRKLHYIEKQIITDIAKKFGVSKGCISAITNGYTWNFDKLTKQKLIAKYTEK